MLNLTQLEEAHTALTQASALLRQVGSVRKTASAEAAAQTPKVDRERLVDVLEDFAALGLAKTAEIEAKADSVVQDPNELVGMLHMMAGHLAAADAVAEAPGTLVKKKASSSGSKVNRIDEVVAEQRAKLARLSK